MNFKSRTSTYLAWYDISTIYWHLCGLRSVFEDWRAQPIFNQFAGYLQTPCLASSYNLLISINTIEFFHKHTGIHRGSRGPDRTNRFSLS
jgi:hypothetical protein